MHNLIIVTKQVVARSNYELRSFRLMMKQFDQTIYPKIGAELRSLAETDLIRIC